MATTQEIKAAQAEIGATADGNFGPRSVDALVAYLRNRGAMRPAETPTGARARVVALAKSNVGAWGEARVDDLWREVGVPEFVGHWHDKAWCGAFALRILQVAIGGAVAQWTWLTGPKVYGFCEAHALLKVKLPELGDIAYFASNQHHAIVVGVGGGMVELVNGNGMTAPAEGVTLTRRPIAEVTCFYSIGRLG